MTFVRMGSPAPQLSMPQPASTVYARDVANGTASGNQDGSFLNKLWRMLSNPAHSAAISWDKTGTKFSVDKELLATTVLGIFFNHSKFASFQRQLR